MTLLQRRASLWLAMSWFLLNIQLEVKAAADRGEATVWRLTHRMISTDEKSSLNHPLEL